MLDRADSEHEHVAARLDATRVAWLTTIRRDGRPHSVPVWFAWSDPLALVFSAPRTAKLENIGVDGRCTLNPETADHGNDVVIIEGVAALPDANDPNVVDLGDTFRRKYADAFEQDFATWRAVFSEPILVRPTRIVAWSKPGGELRYTVVVP